jgi:aminoglycoside phosphotransferase
MRSSWLSELGPTGTVLHGDPKMPLAAWMFSLDEPQAPGSVWVTSRRASSGGNVLHRFVEGQSEPDAVAKVSPRAADELHGLAEIAPAAARAGVRVPDILWSGELGPAEALVQSALSGTSAARLVEQGRLSVAELLTRLCGWLERWSRSEAQPCTLENEDLDRLILVPARRLGGVAPAYLDYLGRLCARAAGSSCPLVPCHGDLTLTNILVEPNHDLGVLDWEEASADGLPLTDFFYSAADAVAASHGYADRAGAVRACFAADGERTPLVRQLMRRVAAALDLNAVVQEVCFHACWLHHGSNEQERGSDPVEQPFRSILGILGDDVEGFSPSLFGS